MYFRGVIHDAAPRGDNHLLSHRSIWGCTCVLRLLRTMRLRWAGYLAGRGSDVKAGVPCAFSPVWCRAFGGLLCLAGVYVRLLRRTAGW